MHNGLNTLPIKKQDELKKRILDIADQQLQETCIKAMTMDRLAEKLGIAKKTIYRFFVSKSDLVDCLIAEKINQYKTALNRSMYTAKNALEQVYLSWHIFDCYICTFTQSLKEDLHKQYPQAYKQITHFSNEYLYRHIKSNIERGITEGFFRENVESAIVATYITNVLFNHYQDVDFYPLKSSSLKVETEMLSYHLYAIATVAASIIIEKYKKEYRAYSYGMDYPVQFNNATVLQ